MSGILCKIFRFILNVFTQIVTVVAEAVKILGDAVVDVLSELIQSVGDAADKLFSGSGILGLLVVGSLGYFLLTSDDDDERKGSEQGERNDGIASIG